MNSIFLLDDNQARCQTITDLLAQSYNVRCASSWEDAHAEMKLNPPQLILIEYSTLNDQGPTLIQKIRECLILQSLPTIMITERRDATAILRSFEMGADDLVCRPVIKEELLVRVLARIRDKIILGTAIHCENLKISYRHQQVWCDGKEIFLTPREFKLLSMLLSDPERILQRELAIKEIWKEVAVSPRNVDTQMNNLKKKLKGFTGQIISVTGVGYKILKHDHTQTS